MSINVTREQRRELARQNAKQPTTLAPVPREQWPDFQIVPIQVWRSRCFLVQQYRAPDPALYRLSVCRTTLSGDRWQDGISWDDLQRLKTEAGFGGWWAVEVYPDEGETVNVANMRHLWLLQSAPSFVWRRSPRKVAT